MILSSPKADSLGIITFKPVLKILGINPMGLSALWEISLDTTSLQPVKKLLEINPKVLSVPSADFLDIISFQKAINTMGLRAPRPNSHVVIAF